MKISLITICYNNADTLPDTIQSVRNQSFKDLEYILIDGGSTDGTLEIIKSNLDLIDYWVSEKDNGLYHAINKGIQKCSGDIIGLIHADDYLNDSEVLSVIAAAFQEKGCDVLYGDLNYVDRQNPSIVKRKWVAKPYSIGMFFGGWMPPHPTFYVRAGVYQQYGLYREDFKISADYEMMLRLMHKHALKHHYINKILVRMRVGGESNASIAHRVLANREDAKAWQVNGLKPKWYTRYLKPLSKIRQFIS